MHFKEVIGQENVKRILTDSVRKSHVSQGLLFCGKEGSGNLALALAFAQFIFCKNPSETDSCGVCTSCIKTKKLVHPDLHFIFPVNTNKEITKDPISDKFLPVWRETILNSPYFTYQDWITKLEIENKQAFINTDDCSKISDKLSLKSYESPYKIMLIWLPEKIHHAGAPKILKILEEPPEKTLFFLVSDNTEMLLTTILSRLQQVLLQPLLSDEILKGLQNINTTQVEDQKLVYISKIAEGNFARALQLLHQEVVDYSGYFLQWMRWCYSIHKDDNIVKVQDWIDELTKHSREDLKHFFSYCLDIIHQCILLNYQVNDFVALEQNQVEAYKKFAPFIHIKNASEIKDEFEKAYYHLERNGSAKMILLDMSLKLAKLIREKDE